MLLLLSRLLPSLGFFFDLCPSLSLVYRQGLSHQWVGTLAAAAAVKSH